ncbi:MAG: NAD(+)/NADH kinase [Gemmatimonadota bacterium]|nr:MAG: NAD(+)/NADH kinase [Gemmatimonadota bacterium]
MKEGYPITSFGIVANPHKDETKRIVPELIRWIEERDLSFALSEELVPLVGYKEKSYPVPDLHDKIEALIALGGDGTILAAARAIGVDNVPILGVKVGGLGFLADITPDELPQTLDKVKAGRYGLSERMTLETIFNAKAYVALNDIVIDKGASPRILDLSIRIGGKFVNTSTADGLIIATPTGSTAYSLSVGGPIVHPRMEAIILSPICPHVLANRPMIVAGDETIEVTIETARGDVKLTVDGQINYALQQGDSVIVRKGSSSVKLVRASSRTYYDVLRAKLKWGVREG